MRNSVLFPNFYVDGNSYMRLVCLVAALSLALQACSGGEPVEPGRYTQTDQFVTLMTDNVEEAPNLQLVADIDHSRLGHEAGSPMPPSRVLIFSDTKLESELIKLNPMTALDFPLRILAFDSGESQKNQVIYNSFDYIASRYQLNDGALSALAAQYDDAIETVTAGIPAEAVASFKNNEMENDGIITLESPYDFEETIARVRAAIESQDDTMYFGTVDFQANGKEIGIDLPPSYMILFGGPGPGGKAMAKATTLGLDGFCQKFLIWQDENGVTHLSFNDLIALARRQGVPVPLVLRVIDFRLNSVFEGALEAS